MRKRKSFLMSVAVPIASPFLAAAPRVCPVLFVVLKLLLLQYCDQRINHLWSAFLAKLPTHAYVGLVRDLDGLLLSSEFVCLFDLLSLSWSAQSLSANKYPGRYPLL